MPFSIRLDAATLAKLRRISWKTRRSQSDVVREAVEQYVAAEARADAQQAPSTANRLTPFIGAVTSGGAQLSHRTHEKYRALLERKHRGRRSR